jgi:iron complex outermembrane receptor protein
MFVPMTFRKFAHLPWLGILAAVVLATSPVRAQTGEQTSAPAVSPGGAVVLGRVVDAATLAPLPGAQIRVSTVPGLALSDANGVFTMRDVPLGDHETMVSRIGYRSRTAVWRVGEQGLELEVQLEVEPLVMQAIQVQSRRFERRVNSSGSTARGFDANELMSSTYPNAKDFVRARMGFVGVSCGALAAPGAGPQDCVQVRGGPARVCIIVDERPAFGGWAEMELLSPQELYRVDVIGGGRVVQVYTTAFVAQMTARSQTPTPADLLSMIACPR